ncbi:hypothetical protein [Streptosporangium vulgare]|uniref:hypothetical protein n=1 Tax=Streptosporangium vulgare TaxID=46190 RepID=UPI0031D3B940
MHAPVGGPRAHAPTGGQVLAVTSGAESFHVDAVVKSRGRRYRTSRPAVGEAVLAA